MALQPSFRQLSTALGRLTKTQTSFSGNTAIGALASLGNVMQTTGPQSFMLGRTAAHTDASPSDGSLTKARKLAVGVGAFAGVFGGLVGLGGGVLISPIIANACRSLPQRVITGTSLAAVTSTSITATLVYGSHGLVDPMAALLLTCGAVFTSPLGARATRLFDCNALRSLTGYWCYFVSPLLPIKMWIFSHLAPAAVAGAAASAAASALVVAAGSAALAADSSTPEQQQLSPGAAPQTQIQSIKNPNAIATVQTANPSSGPGLSSPSIEGATPVIVSSGSSTNGGGSRPVGTHLDVAAVVEPGPPQSSLDLSWLKRYGMRDLQASDASYLGTGAVAGFASGLLGVGGGTIMVPLIAVCNLEMTQAQVVATSLAAMIIPSIAGLAQHAALGNVDVKMAGGLVLGTLVGGFVGSSLGVQAPPGVLEAAFSLGMLLLGRKTLQNVARAKAAAAAVAGKVL